MIKLYGGIASPYVARVAMFAKIKGIDLPVSEAIGGNIKSPEYLKLNPIGKMPTLDVDGKGIGESAVICDYLEDVYKDKPGLPADPFDRARSRLVARIVDIYLAPQGSTLFRQANPATRDAALVEGAGKELAKVSGYLEHAMGPGPFVVGSTPTLGDCALAPSIGMFKIILDTFKFDIPDPVANPRLATWWKAVQSNPDTGSVMKSFEEAFGAFMKSMAARRG